MDLRTELIEFLRVNNWMSLENEANATGVVDVYLKTYKIDCKLSCVGDLLIIVINKIRTN